MLVIQKKKRSKLYTPVWYRNGMFNATRIVKFYVHTSRTLQCDTYNLFFFVINAFLGKVHFKKNK